MFVYELRVQARRLSPQATWRHQVSLFTAQSEGRFALPQAFVTGDALGPATLAVTQRGHRPVASSAAVPGHLRRCRVIRGGAASSAAVPRGPLSAQGRDQRGVES
jgi:hypothetical protein